MTKITTQRAKNAKCAQWSSPLWCISERRPDLGENICVLVNSLAQSFVKPCRTTTTFRSVRPNQRNNSIIFDAPVFFTTAERKKVVMQIWRLKWGRRDDGCSFFLPRVFILCITIQSLRLQWRSDEWGWKLLAGETQTNKLLFFLRFAGNAQKPLAFFCCFFFF